jgi:hypothetical protein
LSVRKEKIVKAPDYCGRDYAAGRIYKLKEWPAARAEKWGIRAALSFNSKGTVQIPMSWAGIGWEGLAVLGINAFLGGGMDPDVVIPILDELLECVTIIRDPKIRDAQHQVLATPLVSDDDIEEVITRGWLRSEVFELHSGFSPADALSKWLSTVERRQDSSKATSDIQTSAPKSDSPSPAAPS